MSVKFLASIWNNTFSSSRLTSGSLTIHVACIVLKQDQNICDLNNSSFLFVEYISFWDWKREFLDLLASKPCLYSHIILVLNSSVSFTIYLAIEVKYQLISSSIYLRYGYILIIIVSNKSGLLPILSFIFSLGSILVLPSILFSSI